MGNHSPIAPLCKQNLPVHGIHLHVALAVMKSREKSVRFSERIWRESFFYADHLVTVTLDFLGMTSSIASSNLSATKRGTSRESPARKGKKCTIVGRVGTGNCSTSDALIPLTTDDFTSLDPVTSSLLNLASWGGMRSSLKDWMVVNWGEVVVV